MGALHEMELASADSNVVLDLELVRGRGNYMLRVIANDGFNSTVVSTESFTAAPD